MVYELYLQCRYFVVLFLPFFSYSCIDRCSVAVAISLSRLIHEILLYFVSFLYRSLSNNNPFAHHCANDVNHCYFGVKFVYTFTKLTLKPMSLLLLLLLPFCFVLVHLLFCFIHIYRSICCVDLASNSI